MSITLELEPKDVVEDAIKKIQLGTEINWLLLGYVEGKAQTLCLYGKGNGGVTELVDKLNNDQALYGYVRVTDVMDGNSVQKFVFLQWIGSAVKTLAKARLSTHLPFVKTLLKHHTVIAATDKSEITPQIVAEKVSDASGSGSRVVGDGRRGSGSGSSVTASTSTPQKRKSFTPASTELKFANPDAAKNILTELRTAATTDYVLFGYDGDTDNLTVVNSGSGGISALVDKLSADAVLYGVLKFNTDKVDNVTNVKIVLITWVGDQVKVMRKARVTTHQGGVQNLVGLFHAAITSSDKAELTESSIKEKLSDLSRTREASSPRASGSSSPTTTTTTTSTTQGFVRRMSDSPSGLTRKPSGSNLVPGTPGTAAAITTPDEKGIKDAIADVRKGPSNWVLLGYEGATSIVVRGKGSGGIPEFVTNLADDKVLYGLIRKEEGNRTKFALIYWVGDKVPYVAKAKITPHKGEVNKLLEPYHADIYVQSAAEITDEFISQKFKTT